MTLDSGAWRGKVRSLRGQQAAPDGAQRMSSGALRELEDALDLYADEVLHSHLSVYSQSLYVDMVTNFVRWLKGDFVPGIRKDPYPLRTQAERNRRGTRTK